MPTQVSRYGEVLDDVTSESASLNREHFTPAETLGISQASKSRNILVTFSCALKMAQMFLALFED